MTGFLPPEWRPLADLRDDMGAAKLGTLLASGRLRAFYLNSRGDRVFMEASDWRRSTAAEAMERGSYFRRMIDRSAFGGPKTHEESSPLYVEIVAPKGRPAVNSADMRPSPPAQAANDAEPPAWAAPSSGPLSRWVRSAGVLEAVERRLKDRGERVSELNKAKELVAMAALSGRPASADTLQRYMRKDRAR